MAESLGLYGGVLALAIVIAFSMRRRKGGKRQVEPDAPAALPEAPDSAPPELGGVLDLKIADILASPKEVEGKEVWIRECAVTPRMRLLGVFSHSLKDRSGEIDGFSREQSDGWGDVKGTVRLTTKGSPYLEF